MELAKVPFFYFKQSTMNFKNAISWFEIPTTDLNRAQNFTKPFLVSA
jgi:hypothetical protein